MNNLDKLNTTGGIDPIAFSKGYTDYLITLLAKLDHQKVAECIQQLERARQNGNTIFVIGNELDDVQYPKNLYLWSEF